MKKIIKPNWFESQIAKYLAKDLIRAKKILEVAYPDRNLSKNPKRKERACQN